MAKNDARVRYTQRVLKEALLRLLRDKPVNKITVKEVCQLADLNRATFYAHYSDCFDLLDCIEKELVDAFGRLLTDSSPFDVRGLIEAIYTMIEQQEEACRVLIFGGVSSSVLPRMIELARQSSLEVWKRQLKRATPEDLEMLYTHLSNGMLHVVTEGYGKYSRESIIGFAERMVQSSLAPYL